MHWGLLQSSLTFSWVPLWTLLEDAGFLLWSPGAVLISSHKIVQYYVFTLYKKVQWCSPPSNSGLEVWGKSRSWLEYIEKKQGVLQCNVMKGKGKGKEVPANLALSELFQDSHCSVVSGSELLFLICESEYLKTPFVSLSLTDNWGIFSAPINVHVNFASPWFCRGVATTCGGCSIDFLSRLEHLGTEVTCRPLASNQGDSWTTCEQHCSARSSCANSSALQAGEVLLPFLAPVLGILLPSLT